jgi:hypothetical protein
MNRLRALHQQIPINDMFCSDEQFIPWQGEVSALLSFNPKLQVDFQGAANSVEPTPFGEMTLDTANLRRANATIRRVLAQAISELELPEEPLKETRIKLTDGQGIWWFISNSTAGVQWKLVLSALGACGAILLVGIGLGQTEFIRNLYIQFHNPEVPRAVSIPTTPQPAAHPTSANTPESTSIKP